MIDRMRRLFRKLDRGENGFTLVEVLVALAILGVIGTGIYISLGTSLIGTAKIDERTTAKNLAESQMEYVKQMTLSPAQYPPPVGEGAYDPSAEIMSEYSGYGVTIYAATADEVDRNEFLQLITIRISHEGEEVMVLEGYKRITGDTYNNA